MQLRIRSVAFDEECPLKKSNCWRTDSVEESYDLSVDEV